MRLSVLLFCWKMIISMPFVICSQWRSEGTAGWKPYGAGRSRGQRPGTPQRAERWGRWGLGTLWFNEMKTRRCRWLPQPDWVLPASSCLLRTQISGSLPPSVSDTGSVCSPWLPVAPSGSLKASAAALGLLSALWELHTKNLLSMLLGIHYQFKLF